MSDIDEYSVETCHDVTESTSKVSKNSETDKRCEKLADRAGNMEDENENNKEDTSELLEDRNKTVEDKKDECFKNETNTILESKKDTNMERREYESKDDDNTFSSKNDHGECDDITEEQENKLLADDCEDLDVIDCYTEDFESDVETESGGKEARKKYTHSTYNIVVEKKTVKSTSESKSLIEGETQKENKSPKDKIEKHSPIDSTTEKSKKSDSIGCNQKTSAEDITEGFVTVVFAEEDNDDDMLQIDDENIELLLVDKAGSNEGNDQSEMSFHAKDEKEQDCILRKPLIKQIVPEITVSDDDDERSDVFGSQESLNLQIDHFVGKASELNLANKKGDISEAGIKITFDSDTCDNETESHLDNCHTEDADFQQLKLEFYENVGAEVEASSSRSIKKHRKEVKKARGSSEDTTEIIFIKEEPLTPVKKRIERLNIPENTIPTIDLTSSDEDDMLNDMAQNFVYEQLKTKKKKTKKRKKHSKHSPDTTALVKSDLSERSMERKRTDSDSISITSFDDILGNSDRIISLRKRMVTVLPETPPKVVCHKKSKRSESDPLKEPVKRKKHDDPLMRGYKRRKPSRSASKSSVRSVSTSAATHVDDEMVGEIEETSHTPRKTADVNDPNSLQSDIQIIDEQEDIELLGSTPLKEAIAKELSAVGSSVEKNTVQNNSNISFPEARTDIALEDMLEDFFEREEAKKNNNAFCSISLEEKMIMDSLFQDCDEPHQSSSFPALKEVNPLFDNQTQPMSTASEQITISYAISDGITSVPAVPISSDDQKSTDVQKCDQLKGPHFKIVQNYDRYKKLLESRPSKPVKVIEPIPRRRKRADSDEDYRPKSYIKKKLFSRPRKRVPTKMEGSNHFRPTGEYLTTDELDLACKDMPSLEHDLALTSSDSGSLENGNVGSSLSVQKFNSKTQLNEQPNLVDNADKATTDDVAKIKTTVKKVKTGKRGRPPVKEKICGFFCSNTGQQKSNCNASCCQNEMFHDPASQSSQFIKPSNKPDSKKIPKKRGRKPTVISSDNVTELFTGNPCPSLTESSDDLSSAPSAILPDYGERDQVQNDCSNEDQTDVKMDNLQVIISPLTEEKIRKINTPKKKRKGLTKACQTEICGLTWLIELDQINFRSEYFEKLRVLLNNGAARNALRRANDVGKFTSQNGTPRNGLESLEGVNMSNRSTLQLPLTSPTSATDSIAEPPCHSRSSVETLLFQKKIDEVETPSTNHNDVWSQKQLIKSLRSTFRIPKLVKQPSRSPQPVTSSTSGVFDTYSSKEDEEQICVMQLPSSSRESASNRAPETAAVLNRPVEREYIDDETESCPSSNCSVQSYAREDPRRSASLPKRFEIATGIKSKENLSSRKSPLNFANALNFKIVHGEDNKKNPDLSTVPVPNNVPQIPMPLENRVVLPDRTEMMNVKRTIKNDISQPTASVTSHVVQQQLQTSEPLQQLPYSSVRPLAPPMPVDYKFTQPSLPGFHTFGTYGGNSFNKSYQSANDFDVKPFASNTYGGWGNFDIMNTGGQHGGFNEFVAMLYEQYKQQQVPSAAALPINVAGPSHLPLFGQWFPPSAVQSIAAAAAVKPQPSLLPSANASSPMFSSEAVEMICYLFGCYDFLVDKCIKLHCRLSHVLPHEEEVLQKLSIQNCDFIMATYRFVNNRDDLFIKYFPVYAGVMGRNKMRHQLVGTIQDCEKPKRPLQYYRYIVEALKTSGTSPTQAVQILVDKHKKTNFHQINILIDLILDTGEGVPSFIRWLEDFLHVKGYSYEMSAINRLLEIVVEQPSRELAKLTSKVVLKVPVGNEQLINTASLLEFSKQARQYPETELDVEDIVKKYGSVVMRV
ncbi:uncharacterized protein LOC129732325 [Wyeomyia smithii]|uniref:uncharacterized protein LOC129732325 n=1 Tax=Wyeomyia smithii TaxID=174621 RepID=UPI0024681DC8|nr:uncharacterized protein LOC129732325 [Wyeomyia smithii]